jgi:hypothetical protein
MDWFTYPNNGDSLDGVSEAGGLIFGVLGHFAYFLIRRRIDSWSVLIVVNVVERDGRGV